MTYRSFLRALSFAACLCIAPWTAQPAVAGEERYPQQTWLEPVPAASGWSQHKFEAADDLARSLGTDAYLVVHHGVVVHKFGLTDRPMNLASARKSVLSILYGIEVDRDKVDLRACERFNFRVHAQRFIASADIAPARLALASAFVTEASR